MRGLSRPAVNGFDANDMERVDRREALGKVAISAGQSKNNFGPSDDQDFRVSHVVVGAVGKEEPNRLKGSLS